jgi:hypothetical protein
MPLGFEPQKRTSEADLAAPIHCGARRTVGIQRQLQQWLSKLDIYKTFWIDPDECSVAGFEELMAGK